MPKIPKSTRTNLNLRHRIVECCIMMISTKQIKWNGWNRDHSENNCELWTKKNYNFQEMKPISARKKKKKKKNQEVENQIVDIPSGLTAKKKGKKNNNNQKNNFGSLNSLKRTLWTRIKCKIPPQQPDNACEFEKWVPVDAQRFIFYFINSFRLRIHLPLQFQ